MTMKVALIENPKSGKDLRFPVIDALREALKDVEIDHVKTEYVGHASSIAMSLINASDALFVAGGDGTLNDTVQQISGITTVPILVIPTGTGSDFAKSLGIYSIQDSIQAFRNKKVVRVDSAMSHFDGKDRLFVNIAEIGFGASVMDRVNRSDTGRNVFMRSIMREVFNLKSYDLKVSCDGSEKEFSTAEIIIANGQYFGKGMHASPGSRMDDGFLDIHLIRRLGRLSLLMKLGSLRSGKYIEKNVVENFSCRKVSISGEKAPIEMDGEVVGFTPVTIEVIPGSLSFYSNM
ncbi:MAG: diacylglycerol kinase family protein [Thermoplasmataceae archaeon]|jgi:YegS/Rv2252/BmrU family lipid kinase